MKEKDLLKTILERLARLDGMSNVFTADEVSSWPAGAIDSLIDQGLLTKAESAQTLECTGCEESCLMPVNLLRHENTGTVKAFISCDKRDDVGRVTVEMARLKQWKITGHSLALKLADMLGLEQEPKEKPGGKSWELGILKGKAGRPHLSLHLENGVNLKIGTHEVALLDMLTFKKGELSLDVDEIVRLVNQTESTSKYKPSDIKREANKLKKRELYKSWREKYHELKKANPAKPDTWCAFQMKKHFNCKQSTETIRKKMKR